MGFETSAEMFINMRPQDIPQWNPLKSYYDQELSTLQFYEEELRKIKEGVNIGGYFVHPLLYFHLNFFKTPIPQPDKSERMMNPPLDDHILYFVESYEDARINNNILFMFGTRGFSKSTIITSLTQQTIITKPNGNFSIIGGSDPDLLSISSLMEKAFNDVHPAFFIPTLTKDWDSHIEFGFRDKAVGGRRYIHSEIMISNANKGTQKSSEKGAGLSPIGFVLDEAGKFGFKKILESAIPSFKTQYGFKLVPILSGTSGNIDLAKDAQEVLENPEAYRVLPMNWDRLDRFCDLEQMTWEHNKKRKNFGTYVPGQMSYRLETPKIKTTFADFIGIDHPELRSIDYYKTDWKKTTEEVQGMINASKKDDKKNRDRMYHPLNLDDIFLTTSPNPFPVQAINKRIRELEESGNTGRAVTIVREGSEYKAVFSDKRRAEVSHPGGSVDSPIFLFGELPETPPERYVFVSGLDDYKQDVSDTDSLGAFYVIRRRNLAPNTPCETIAASIATRPERHKDFHQTLETMIEAWAAECLMESADTSFKQYLETKFKAAKWLAPAITFSNRKGTRSKGVTDYGLYPTAGNNEYRFNLLVDWCWEEHTMGIDDQGNTIVKYGVEFIDDVDLLKEMRDWRKGGNFDRIAAFSHALVHAVQLDNDDVRPKSHKGQKADFLKRNSDKGADLFEKPSAKLHSPFGSMRPSSPFTFLKKPR